MPSGLGISASQNPACTLITWETAKIPDSRASWAADAIGPGTAFWGARLYSLPRMPFSFCSTRLCHQLLGACRTSSGDDCRLCSVSLSGGSISAPSTGHHNGRNLPSAHIDHSTLSGDGTRTGLLPCVSPVLTSSIAWHRLEKELLRARVKALRISVHLGTPGTLHPNPGL